MSLSVEQHRALTFLTTAAVNGATQSLLAAHDFRGAIISGMVNRGYVTLSFEKFRASGKMIKVRKVRITPPGGALLLSIIDARLGVASASKTGHRPTSGVINFTQRRTRRRRIISE
jgi:hypothetical protein